MKGKIFAIEGADCSGKHTQSKMLLERLQKEGKEAVLISFPRYETFTGSLVTKYLKGEFGSLEKVKPEFAALLYSLDRYDAVGQIEQWLSEGKVIICDRYIASNVAHQAAKFKGEQQEKFIEWVEGIESRLPQPSLTIYLDLPVSVSATLMKGRTRAKDIHELNQEYLEATRRVYLLLCRGENWAKIDCAGAKGGIRPKEEIHKMVWESLNL